jgi:hypothetical protein
MLLWVVRRAKYLVRRVKFMKSFRSAMGVKRRMEKLRKKLLFDISLVSKRRTKWKIVFERYEFRLYYLTMFHHIHVMNNTTILQSNNSPTSLFIFIQIIFFIGLWWNAFNRRNRNLCCWNYRYSH